MTKWPVDGSVADRPEGVLQNERENLDWQRLLRQDHRLFQEEEIGGPIAFVYSSRFWQFCDLLFGLAIGPRFVRGNAC